MCVCCLGEEALYGRGAQMAATEFLWSILPDPITQELPAMAMGLPPSQ